MTNEIHEDIEIIFLFLYLHVCKKCGDLSLQNWIQNILNGCFLLKMHFHFCHCSYKGSYFEAFSLASQFERNIAVNPVQKLH